MSFMQNLINKLIPVSSIKPAPGMKFKINDEILHVQKINWIAPGNYSSNKKYFVAGKKSEIVLVDREQKQILYHTDHFRLINPYNLQVSDHGRVLVEDNHDQEDKLHSVFHVLSIEGRNILSYDIGANIANCAINQSDTIAIIQTTASAQPEYDQLLHIIDINSGRCIHRWRPAHGTADAYSFHQEGTHMTLHYHAGNIMHSYTYTISGTLLSKVIPD